MSNGGFLNEKEIVENINNKKFDDLNPNLKNLIKFSFSQHDGIIKCSQEGGQNKSDIKISIGKESHTYSIKIGSGNSIHQEPLESFINYLDENFSINEETKNNLRLFIWGDKTLDGSGKVGDRLSANQFKREYPETIEDLSVFFDLYRKELIERFLINGDKSCSSAEFVYYGDYKNGIFARSIDLLNYVSSYKSKGAIPIGKLTFQAWNRNINGGTKSEKKRGVIQLKWPTISQDIKESFHE